MRPNIRILALAALGAVAGLTACDDTTGANDQTTLRILLTDAPADYIAGAWVDIGAVELLAHGGSRVALSEDGTDGMVNLLDLQDAATTTLAQTDIEPGTYHQLRLVIDSARVELAEGYTFTDGTTVKPLTIPSGAQTGIKLNLNAGYGHGHGQGQGQGHGQPGGAGVEIIPGETVLVLDFDVNQSFVIQGNPETSAGILGVLFRPMIRVTVRDIAASISGTVATSVDGLSVEGLEVTAEPVEGSTVEPYQTETAAALTAADGTYTLHFLVPGTYTVRVAAPEGYAADPVDIAVTVDPAEDAVAVDFDIVAGAT